MCRSATPILLLALFCVAAEAQSANSREWRKIGNSVVESGLPSPAGGAVDRVWFSGDSGLVMVRVANGSVWRSEDGERWTAAPPTTAPNVSPQPATLRSPETNAKLATARNGVLYAAGQHVWRSEDAGANWKNVTEFRGRSILGGPATDLAVAPNSLDEVIVTTRDGVWRSVDGGATWSGLNDGLPNLPAVRLLRGSDEESAARIRTTSGLDAIWLHGERVAWRPVPHQQTEDEELLAQIPAERAATAAARSGEVIYAGSAEGILSVSSDRGRTWTTAPAVAGASRVLRIVTDVRDPAFALAITSAPTGGARVLRTVNRGAFWDDITGNLPAGPVRGIAADRITGTVYLATAAGVFQAVIDTRAASPPANWSSLRPEPALDVMLDAAGHQLFVLSEGTGVYATLAPHRARDPRVLSAADRVARAAAPGALLSVLGAKVQSATVGDQPASVLAATSEESQIQLPWDLPQTLVQISMFAEGGGRLQLGLPVANASPAIFVDKDGSPLLLDGDSGLVLDAGSPARARTRLQILATGLGRVDPDWPVGLAAPLQDAPRVRVPVRAWLDREPLEVVSATLAPGYVGLYLVEVRVPALVNRGTAELFIEAGGLASNRVRVWLEP